MTEDEGMPHVEAGQSTIGVARTGYELAPTALHARDIRIGPRFISAGVI
jgi:hypothetical protein